MDPPSSAGDLVRFAGLGDAALDRVRDQLLVPLAPGSAVIYLGDQSPSGVEAVGVGPR